MVERVVATEETLALITQLKAEHGEMLFHQSGGCCDGSAPNCFLPNEIMMGAQDILLGEIGGKGERSRFLHHRRQLSEAGSGDAERRDQARGEVQHPALDARADA